MNKSFLVNLCYRRQMCLADGGGLGERERVESTCVVRQLHLVNNETQMRLIWTCENVRQLWGARGTSGARTSRIIIFVLFKSFHLQWICTWIKMNKPQGMRFHTTNDTHTRNSLVEKENCRDTTMDDDSPICDIFRGKCVFLTGCTGFLGQLYLAKLLG